MKILKVLNNNVVTVKTEAGEEVIIMGCGLAFGKKRGDNVDESKIEKIFTQTREDKNLYKKLTEEKQNLFVVDWYKDNQASTTVKDAIISSLDADLPQSFDKDAFDSKINLLL